MGQRLIARAAFGLLVAFAVSACRLDATDKTGCVESDDCLEQRVCVDGQCSDEACDNLCARYCDRAEICDAAPSDCVEFCVVSPSEMQCKASFDGVDELTCEGVTCLQQCVAVCDRALGCSLIADRERCVAGCWTWGYCPTVVSACTELPNVVCYEPDSPCT